MRNATAAGSTRTLSLSHWWVLAFALFVTIPVVLGFAFLNQIHAWYLREFVAPGLERDLGFRGGPITIVDSGKPYGWWGILSVTPGGEFDRAGIRAGDVPIGYQHGVESGFLSDLHHARGSSVTLSFVSGRTSLSSSNGGEKRVTIAVPPKRAG
jgi:S1-C subfamily serine protease